MATTTTAAFARMTLSLTRPLKRRMVKHPKLNWSQIAREAFAHALDVAEGKAPPAAVAAAPGVAPSAGARVLEGAQAALTHARAAAALPGPAGGLTRADELVLEMAVARLAELARGGGRSRELSDLVTIFDATLRRARGDQPGAPSSVAGAALTLNGTTNGKVHPHTS